MRPVSHRWRKGLWGLGLLSSCFYVHAAALHVESFDSDASGWQFASILAAVTTHDSGAANPNIKVTVPGVPQPIPGDGARIFAESGASGGAFFGDVSSVGGRVLGFRFLAEDQVPSEVELRWASGGNNFSLLLHSHVQSVGVWYHFTVSLASVAAGPWNGGVGSDVLFENSLQAVDRVQLRVVASHSPSEQIFRFDDIHLSTIPLVDELAPGAVHHVVSAAGLTTGFDYQLLSRNLATGQETVLSNFTATAAIDTLSVAHGGSIAENYLLRFVQ